jgi:hypothetical protein
LRPRVTLIGLIWSSVLVILLITQLFVSTLRTPWGTRAVPAALVKLGLVRPDRVFLLTSLVRPPGEATVLVLQKQIETSTPAHEPVTLVWRGKPNPYAMYELRYGLYPRPVHQQPGSAGNSAPECRIDWYSDEDAVLRCPQAAPAGSQPGIVPR